MQASGLQPLLIAGALANNLLMLHLIVTNKSTATLLGMQNEKSGCACGTSVKTLQNCSCLVMAAPMKKNKPSSMHCWEIQC